MPLKQNVSITHLKHVNLAQLIELELIALVLKVFNINLIQGYNDTRVSIC
jgi:hypothetical protein